MTISPCISICKKDPITGYCYGCCRTKEEIQKWKDNEASLEWKNKNLNEIQNRMSEWQLNRFKESYNYKCVHGISLIKKRKLEENK